MDLLGFLAAFMSLADLSCGPSGQADAPEVGRYIFNSL